MSTMTDELVRAAYIDPAPWANPDRAGVNFDEWLEQHDKSVKRIAWHEGATSRQCHCHAYSEGECACGMWPSEPNPYT